MGCSASPSFDVGVPFPYKQAYLILASKFAYVHIQKMCMYIHIDTRKQIQLIIHDPGPQLQQGGCEKARSRSSGPNPQIVWSADSQPRPLNSVNRRRYCRCPANNPRSCLHF